MKRMNSFVCPFCEALTSKTIANYKQYYIPIEILKHNPMGPVPDGDVILIECFICASCGELSVTATRDWGDHPFTANVYPRSVFTRFPDYVPEAIRKDYQEACTILNDSPRAAATLCRRCLQGMIRDFWNIRRNTLNEEINALKSIVPATQWKVLDSLRKLGNIGAHMEKDVNLMIDIDRKTAAMLVKLIERMIKEWYIESHETEALYNDIIAANAEAQHKRNP